MEENLPKPTRKSANKAQGPVKTSRIVGRLVESSVSIALDKATIEDAIFQHSVLCQTFLPYRNPGEEVRVWQQKQGNVTLAVQAISTLNPQNNDFEFFGLPYGAKARLILAHLNSEAVKTQQPLIDVEKTMTGFIKKIGLSTDGRTVREVKEQLARLSSSLISMGYSDGERGMQVNVMIAKAFDIWFPKNENQRVAWNSKIQLTDEYFNSLVKHAIPLDIRALAALSHNAMALDIYVWLAQRLHRVPPGKPQFISWLQTKEQFGQGYDRMDNFKQVFRRTLASVLTQYRTARIDEDLNKGFNLHHSPSPIPPKTQLQIGTGEGGLLGF